MLSAITLISQTNSTVMISAVFSAIN